MPFAHRENREKIAKIAKIAKKSRKLRFFALASRKIQVCRDEHRVKYRCAGTKGNRKPREVQRLRTEPERLEEEMRLLKEKHEEEKAEALRRGKLAGCPCFSHPYFTRF